MAAGTVRGMEIAAGQQLTVVDAFGQEWDKRVIAAPANGNGSVVTCGEDEWAAAHQAGRDPEPDPFPWPMSAIRLREES